MPDTGVYVDTSVLGAYYCPEPLSAISEDSLRKIKAPVISVLSEVEFGALISRKQRLRELSQRRAREILDLFESQVQGRTPAQSNLAWRSSLVVTSSPSAWLWCRQ